jgi:dihydropteroate synthase-like protein
MDSLYRSIDRLLSSGKPFVADAILEPFPYGFTASIVRYNELRTRYPACDILMGTGNITELMDADTSGITSLLISMAAEMSIGSILTTEVSPHACRAVREADLARRIMFAAQRDKQLPRRYDTGLMTIHDKKPFPYTSTEIASIADSIKDKSYRIQVSEEGIHLYNREGFNTADDPYDLLGEIDVGKDLSHMFYLGVELGRAQIAWQLGKRYSQDSELEWGVAQRAQAIVADGAGQP